MPNLFIDFDGTLIDSRPRQYRLFKELAPQCSLSFDQYWVIKRERVNQRSMLQRYAGITDETEIAEFHAKWMQNIEAPERLLEDGKLPGSDRFLEMMFGRFTLYLLTARQHPVRAKEQVAHLGWTDRFEAVLVTQQRQSKASLIRTMSYGPDDVIIGDTGEDITAAREVGIRSIAVCTGMLERRILHEYKPTLLVKDLTELTDQDVGIAFLGRTNG